MRSLFFLFLVIPFFAGAQVNRSAKELASEKVREYIVSKLFRDKPYKPVSFGDIKAIDDKRTKIAWAIAHKFEITEGNGTSFDRSPKVQKSHQFMFYFDKKMRLLKAETWYVN